MSLRTKAKNILVSLRGIIFPLFLLLVVLLLAITNYVPGTWLSGWDNLHSEFDFSLNWSRTVGAAWQEHQGLGISATMAYAADAPRLVVIQLLDVVFSANDLRYVYLFLCLYIGVVGVFYLIRWVLKQSFSNSNLLSIIDFAAFAGSLFYLFNLGTLQSFYAPIEMFPTQWAYLPWIFLSFFAAVRYGRLINYFLFALVCLMAAPMAYTPTLFFVVCVALFVVGLGILASSAWEGKFSVSFKRLSLLALTLFIVNTFWVLPLLGTLSQGGGSSVVEAKINQMASEDSFAMNVEYGTAENIALLKGFWFGNYDYNTETKEYVPMMQSWIDYQAIPAVQVIGYLLFAVVALGAVAGVMQGINYAGSLLAVLILGLFALSATNPPLGELFLWITQHVPLVGEALRFPFTKFAALTAMLYAVFFAFAMFTLYRLLKKLIYVDLSFAYTAVIAVVLVIYCFPMFTGNLVYKQLQVNIPAEYFQLFDYFKQQKNGPRVATLPQQTFWSWNFYDWGYRGSGFLWYGIKQPTMDRAFDVWGKQNETYYEEISQAIYRLDIKEIKRLSEKYQLGWFVYDASIAVTLNNNHVSFYRDQLIPTLTGEPGFKLEKNLNNHLYIISYKPVIDNYQHISTQRIESVQAAHGDYLQIGTNLGSYTNKEGLERGENKITHKFNFDIATQLKLGDYWEYQKYLPVEVSAMQTNEQITVTLDGVLPTFSVNGQVITQKKITQAFTLPTGEYYFAANGTVVDLQTLIDGKPTGQLLLSQDGKLRIYTKANSEIYNFDTTLRNLKVSHCSDTQNSINARADHTIEGDELVLNARNAIACFFVGLVPQFNSSFLLQTSLAYRPLTGDLPVVCVLLNDRCWNKGISTDINKSSGLYTALTQFTELPSTSQASAGLQIMIGETRNSSIHSVALKDVTVSYFPLVEEKAFNFVLEPQVLQLSAQTELLIEYPILNAENIYKAISLKDLGSKSQIRDCGAAGTGLAESLYRQLGNVQLRSEDAEACLIISDIGLPLDADYLFYTNTTNVAGQKLKVCVGNPFLGKCIDEYELNNNGEVHIASIPAQTVSSGVRELRFNNVSRGNWATVNNVNTAEFIFYPTNYLHQAVIASQPLQNDLVIKYQYQVLPFWYRVQTSGTGILKLDQAYMPLWFSSNSANHIKVNEWQNGWQLSGNQSIEIVYLPGLLEIIGYAFSMLLFAYLAIRSLINFVTD